MSRQRLTLKLSGGHRLLVEHFDLEEPVSEADFRAAAEKMRAAMSQRKTAKRPAERKHTAMRGGDDG